MKTSSLSLILVILLVAFLSACQQMEVIEREQRRMRNDISSMQTDLEGIRGNQADARANMQQMQRDLNAIKDRVDEARVQMGKQLGQTSREGDQRVRNLETRLAKLEDDLKNQADLLKKRDDEIKQLRESAQAAQTTQAEQRAEAAAATDRLAEANLAESDAIRKDYEGALRPLDKKDYKTAASRLKEFIKKYPKSKLAGNAQYWIGECSYATKDLGQAIVEFDLVRSKYPQSDKVPAALLKQGFAFADMGEKVNARLVLQELVERFPQSAEAERAKQRLKAIES